MSCYDDIKQLSRELGRPAETLFVLGDVNDPFYITPARQREAAWFGEIWRQLHMPTAHYRRIYYPLVSLQTPVIMTSGFPFLNTHDCWKKLNPMARDAVYLGLVPPEAYEDRRNAEPVIYQAESEPASLDVCDANPDLGVTFTMPDVPHLVFSSPKIPQSVAVEIWCEKTTVNDILLPLAQEYDLNLQTGVGEISAIYCRELVGRVARHRRPTRILYVSDFDPGGQSMPVAVAVKIAFELHRQNRSGLDIQVRPVALTYEQCVEFKLPRLPNKDTEKRANHFEARFGEGITELDALEAIRPGQLRRILLDEISRYRDDEHQKHIAEQCTAIEAEIDDINEAAISSHEADLDQLRAEFNDIRDAYDAWLERAQPIWDAISDDLEEAAPGVDLDVRPRPDWQAMEDAAALYDSTRGYVEQVDRFKEFQGKPIQRRDFDRPLSMTANAIRKRRARLNGGPVATD
jgi:hypothetical protein